MHHLAAALQDVLDSSGNAALATVVRTSGSAPLDAGAAMLVTDSGDVIGSVSGGCVESAVYESAQEVIAGREARLEVYGFSDEVALGVGLTCGGSLEVFIEPVSIGSFPQLEDVLSDIRHGKSVAVATVISHPDPGRIGEHMAIRPSGLDGNPIETRAQKHDSLIRDAQELLSAGRNEVLEYSNLSDYGDLRQQVFVRSFTSPPRMLIFGAIDFATALSRIGRFLGYRVTVCDARPTFTTSKRFPDAHQVVVRWPDDYLIEEVDAGRIDERSAVCVLTHDSKFDVPVLERALRYSEAGYIGAMGSHRTHQDRLRRLRDAGLADYEISRLRSPIGLDLGGRSPEETAVSIVAEIIALHRGRSGKPLNTLLGPIHGEPTLMNAP
ncbi:XdhC family protein [Nesterenkonia muleiensis]|uniref:XdhC family protein n=1 Tax=Nesterenkonia muleiensis TaxID=2282648 RepID=UPI001EE4B9C5|nr:XdhC/CoxI family protein [Nesterenkonia muleiensis]